MAPADRNRPAVARHGTVAGERETDLVEERTGPERGTKPLERAAGRRGGIACAEPVADDQEGQPRGDPNQVVLTGEGVE